MSIFTQTTSTKAELFNTLIGLMVAAGWQDISSNYATDFVVMYSKGESGDKDLCIQLRPTSTTNTNDISTATASIMSYRLINAYTPNENSGAAGVFARPSEAWRAWQIAPLSVDPSVELVIWHSVNKNRAIFNIYTPESLNALPVMTYFGLPVHYTSEPASKGLVAMTSYASPFSGTVHISDNVAEIQSLTASTSITPLFQLPPKSPNSAGIHTPFELFYGNASVGIRGKFDSIFFLPNNTVNDGDILKLGAKRFRATLLAVSGNNSFPTNNIIYQIS